jgi:hypothetical protein
MDRTLFTPPMIETFRVCRRAYQLAFLGGRQGPEKVKLQTICKRFLLRAITEIHKGRIQNLPQVQKYLGQHWPAERLVFDGDDITGQEQSIQAFRFVYRVLAHYISNPYKPKGGEPVGICSKARARVPHSKVYLEDTFDLIIWHPEKRQLELVDFHLSPLKPFDPAWPAPSILIRFFLAQRLRQRWPFDKLVMTYCQLHSDRTTPVSFEIDESTFRLHWPELLKTINQMKDPEDYAPHRSEICRRCQFLTQCLAMGQPGETGQENAVGLSA